MAVWLEVQKDGVRVKRHKVNPWVLTPKGSLKRIAPLDEFTAYWQRKLDGDLPGRGLKAVIVNYPTQEEIDAKING